MLNNTKAKAETFVGTFYYLSPEVWEGQPYNWKSDIWALGVVLYEMAALRPPWFSSDAGQLRGFIPNGKYPPLPDCYTFKLKNIV